MAQVCGSARISAAELELQGGFVHRHEHLHERVDHPGEQVRLQGMSAVAWGVQMGCASCMFAKALRRAQWGARSRTGPSLLGYARRAGQLVRRSLADARGARGPVVDIANGASSAPQGSAPIPTRPTCTDLSRFCEAREMKAFRCRGCSRPRTSSAHPRRCTSLTTRRS